MRTRSYTRVLSTFTKFTGITTLGLLAAVAVVPQASAVDVYTDPVGFITLTAKSNGFNFVSLAMTRLPVNRGSIGTPTATKIPVSTALSAGQFNPSTGTNYFIEIVSGANAGLQDDIVSNDTANVFTASNIAGLIANGQLYKIYPTWTPDTVFGPPAQSGLNGAATASAADNIIVFDPLSQTPVTYFYRTSGTPGWRSNLQGLTVNAGTNVLYLDQGFIIQRKPPGSDTNLLLVGGVKLGPTVIPVVSNGFTFAANVYPVSTTMNQTGLFTTNSATGVFGAATASAADNVIVWDLNSQTPVTYFWRTSGTPGWRSNLQGLTVEAGTNSIPLGAMLKIQRKPGTPAFNWVPQQPFTNP